MKIGILAVLSLPLLLHVFNPSMQLGGIGLFLGFWGMFVSPFTLLLLIYFVVKR